MSKNGQGQSGKKADRDEKGRLLPGHSQLNGQGRPKGSVDWMTTWKAWAAGRKWTVEQAARKLQDALWSKGVGDGDPTVLKMLGERVFGAVERAPLLAMQFNQNTIHVGQQARTELRELAVSEDVQDLMLDVLEGRTMEEG